MVLSRHHRVIELRESNELVWSGVTLQGVCPPRYDNNVAFDVALTAVDPVNACGVHSCLCIVSFELNSKHRAHFWNDYIVNSNVEIKRPPCCTTLASGEKKTLWGSLSSFSSLCSVTGFAICGLADSDRPIEGEIPLWEPLLATRAALQSWAVIVYGACDSALKGVNTPVNGATSESGFTYDFIYFYAGYIEASNIPSFQSRRSFAAIAASVLLNVVTFEDVEYRCGRAIHFLGDLRTRDMPRIQTDDLTFEFWGKFHFDGLRS